MDLILIIVFIAVGYWIGKIHAYWNFAKLMRSVAEEAGFDLEKELRKIDGEEEDTETLVYKLEVETHGEMLYLFDHETDEFICQGKSVQELCELAKKYKQVVYAAVKYNDKVFSFKDGESTEVTA